jgi:hypothetical protein
MIIDSQTRLAKSVIELRELVVSFILRLGWIAFDSLTQVYARTVPAFENDADLAAAETQLQEANV